MKTSGNKILITGGTRGIGFVMMQKFLSENNEVIITGRNHFLLSSLKEMYPGLMTYQADFSNPDDVASLVEKLKEYHPDINILVNNAAIQYNYNINEEDHVLSKVNEELATNLSAPIDLTLGLLDNIKMQENAAIVNVTSALAFVPKQSALMYCASKSGLHSFTQVLRYQMEGQVKVFELIPTLVDTHMTFGRGTNKMSPEALVSHFFKAFKNDVYEINIGKVKVLRVLDRLFPKLARKMMRYK